AMLGGAGDDYYIVANPTDLVSESIGGGFDVVVTAVDYTLQANQEIEVLSALPPSAPAGVTGNAEIDAALASLPPFTTALSLTGNERANVLIGGAGNDTLTGGGGADGFRFQVPFGAGANVDTIADFDPTQDHFELDPTLFAGLPAGTLDSAHLAYGSA